MKNIDIIKHIQQTGKCPDIPMSSEVTELADKTRKEVRGR